MCFNESENQVIVHILFLLFNLRVDNNDGDTNFLQSNTYLQQPKLPTCCDFCGPLAGSICQKKGPRPVSICKKDDVTAWNTSQYWLDDRMKKGEEMKQGIRIEGEQEMTTWGVEIRRLRRMCCLIKMLPCSLV